jgi:RimJ/RimL family protein N-acetyltransferase
MPFIETDRLTIVKLEQRHVSEEYLGWLNDQEVMSYRGPKAYPMTVAGMREYIEEVDRRGDLVVALHVKADNDKHIGNIALNTINWTHRSAELSIMIGDKSYWGGGYATEGIKAVVDHAFQRMNLHRVWLETPNPALARAVEKLGWKKQGEWASAFWREDKYIPFHCWATWQEDK